MSASKSKEVSNPFAVSKEIPDFMRGMDQGAVGNANVSSDDLAIPQLKILQPGSPEVLQDGKAPAMMYNTVTEESYKELYVVGLDYETEFVIWKDRTLGGGRISQHDSNRQAVEAVNNLPGSADDYNIADTGIQKLLLLDDKFAPVSPALLYCSSTLKYFSDAWNSSIQIELSSKGMPRFAGIWKLRCIQKRNNRNEGWTSLAVEFVGYVSQDLFTLAEKQALSLTRETEKSKLEKLAQAG